MPILARIILRRAVYCDDPMFGAGGCEACGQPMSDHLAQMHHARLEAEVRVLPRVLYLRPQVRRAA